jgi:hypothetical protein
VLNVKGAGATGAGKSGCSFCFYDSNSSLLIPPHPSYLSATPTSLRFLSSIFSCSRTQLHLHRLWRFWSKGEHFVGPLSTVPGQEYLLIHLRHSTDLPSKPPFLSPRVQDILPPIAETDREMRLETRSKRCLAILGDQVVTRVLAQQSTDAPTTREFSSLVLALTIGGYHRSTATGAHSVTRTTGPETQESPGFGYPMPNPHHDYYPSPRTIPYLTHAKTIIPRKHGTPPGLGGRERL